VTKPQMTQTKLDELERMMREDAELGYGPSTNPADNNFWANGDAEYCRWCRAFENIDRYGDKTELLALLLEGDLVHRHLADLLDRYELRRKRGKPRTPSYDRSYRMQYLEMAVVQARRDVRGGMTVADAIEKHATNGISEAALEAAYRGKHGGLRRIKKR
jgi:hypothetical protein